MPTPSDFSDFRFRPNENTQGGDFSPTADAPAGLAVPGGTYPNMAGGFEPDNEQFSSDKEGDPKVLFEQTRPAIEAHGALNESYGLRQPVATLGSHPWLRIRLPILRNRNRAMPLRTTRSELRFGSMRNMTVFRNNSEPDPMPATTAQLDQQAAELAGKQPGSKTAFATGQDAGLSQSLADLRKGYTAAAHVQTEESRQHAINRAMVDAAIDANSPRTAVNFVGERTDHSLAGDSRQVPSSDPAWRIPVGLRFSVLSRSSLGFARGRNTSRAPRYVTTRGKRCHRSPVAARRFLSSCRLAPPRPSR